MKTVIEMAREAGLLAIGTADGSEAVYTWPHGITDELERFAALVAAAEREACARICETEWSTTQEHVHGLALADMIRARGNT